MVNSITFLYYLSRYSYISKFNKSHIEIILKRKLQSFHALSSLKSKPNRGLFTIFALVKLSELFLPSCLYFYFILFFPTSLPQTCYGFILRTKKLNIYFQSEETLDLIFFRSFPPSSLGNMELETAQIYRAVMYIPLCSRC